MKSIRIISSIATIMLIFPACEKVIDVQLRESEPRLVIESVVTDDSNNFMVHVTRTQDYFATNLHPGVTNASVLIRDDQNNTDTLFHKTNGYYSTLYKKRGVTNRTYFLEVNVDGKLYTANSRIMPQNPMDSIRPVYISKQTTFQDSGYYLMVYEKEYPFGTNYYRWIQYRNGVKQEDPIRYLMNDDKLLANIPYVVAQLPYKYSYGDTAVVEQLSVTKEYYDYFIALDMQLNRGGGPFDAPPGNPATNITGGALGYFFAVGIDRKTLIVK